jgi:hypothetical protein
MPSAAVVQSLTVEKLAVSVVPMNNQFKIYGDDDPAITFELIPTLIQGDVITGRLSREVGEEVGTYNLNLGNLEINQNYTVSLTIEVFEIKKRTLTITSENTTKLYGEPNPEFNLQFDGFVFADNASTIDTLPTIACQATDSSLCGSYPIMLSNGSDDNYEIQCIGGLLQVMAVLGSSTTIKVENIAPTYAKVYGELSGHGGELNATRGFVYAETENPTVDDHRIDVGSGLGNYAYILEALNTHSTYYVRTFVENIAGITYGNEISFITLPSSIYVLDAEIITIFPNPSGGVFTINLGGIFNGMVQVTIINTYGEIIKEKTYEKAEVFELDLSPFKQGIYFCRLENKGKTEIVKLMKE